MMSEIRSLMQQHTLSDSDRVTLLNLLLRSHSDSHEHHTNTIIPYITSFPHHFATPLATYAQPEHLEHAALAAPCATFTYKIERNEFGDSLDYFLNSHAARQVCTLVISNQIHPITTYKKIFNFKKLINITHLHITNAKFTNTALKILAQADNLSQLSHLDLSHNSIGASGVLHLVNADFFKTIQYFNLAHNNIKSEGVSHIANATHNVHTLNLAHNKMTNEGAQALAMSPSSHALHTLNLAHNKISPPGIQQIAQSTHLYNLQHLDLTFNDCNLHAYQAIADSPFMSTSVKAQFSKNL